MGEDYRELLGYMPQDFGYYREYSAERFLRMDRYYLKHPQKDQIDELSNGKEDDINNAWFIGESIAVHFGY